MCRGEKLQGSLAWFYGCRSSIIAGRLRTLARFLSLLLDTVDSHGIIKYELLRLRILLPI